MLLTRLLVAACAVHFASPSKCPIQSKIDAALDAYDDSSFDRYQSVVDQDLRAWQADGVPRALFERALERYVYDGKHSRAARLTHYQSIEGSLFRSEHCYIPSRCQGVEHFLLQLLPSLPDFEIIVNIQDHPHVHPRGPHFPIFSFSKSAQYLDIHYPAWTFWAGGPANTHNPTGMGRWDLKIQELDKAEKSWPWEEKLNQVFFRGSRTDEQRDPLILLARELPAVVDAQFTASGSKRVNDKTVTDGLGPIADQVSLEDHCKFRFLFNFKGVAASFRLKHLFLCKSLVFHVGDLWTEFFYFDLQPYVHYLPVQADMSDAQAMIEYAMHPDNAETIQKIIENGYNFIRENLDFDDISDYWLRLLQGFTALTPWVKEHERRSGTVQVLAGGRKYGPVYTKPQEEPSEARREL